MAGVRTISPLAASARINAEFGRRAWRLAEPFPNDLVQRVVQAGGAISAANLAKHVPRVFLTTNGISRADVTEALGRALDGYRVLDGFRDAGLTQVFNTKVEIMEKKNEVNNYGQWAGNVDSPNSQASVERQQQVQITAAEEQSLREHLGDEEVQKVMALDLPAEEKTPILGRRLAQAAGVARDTATSFAAKFLAELVKAQGT
jgi:hypothetical protein